MLHPPDRGAQKKQSSGKAAVGGRTGRAGRRGRNGFRPDARMLTHMKSPERARKMFAITETHGVPELLQGLKEVKSQYQS